MWRVDEIHFLVIKGIRIRPINDKKFGKFRNPSNTGVIKLKCYKHHLTN